jgi:hypothetical protein
MKAYLTNGTTIDGVEDIVEKDNGVLLADDGEAMGYIPQELLYCVVPDDVEIEVPSQGPLFRERTP